MAQKPIYRVIADKVAESIIKGEMCENTKLPSIRKLANEYGVSNLTALNAMRLLEDELVVYAIPKKGYFVKIQQSDTHIQSNNLLNEKGKLYTLLSAENSSGLALSNGSIDLYPVQKISKIMRKQIYQNPNLLGGNISGHGNKYLIEEIIRRAIEYSCSFSKDEICITNGGLESLSLALRAVTSSGDTVIVQSPTYFYTLKFISELGLNYLSVQSFGDIEKQLKKNTVTAIIYNANFNNPDGLLLDEVQKKQLITLSQEHNVTIIEDDVYGDIYFTDSRPKPLRAYSSDVILCNSFTKAIAPGLRVGWIAGAQYTPTIKELKQSTSKFTAEFPQAAIAEFLSSGGYDLHMRKLRTTLVSFRDEVRSAILKSFPDGTSVSTPKGGFVLWITLPEKLADISAKIDAALQIGNHFIPGRFFSIDDNYHNCLRFNYGFGLTEQSSQVIRNIGIIFNT